MAPDAQVTSSASPFKATLVWTDPPSFPGSARALINDLNLVIVDAVETYHYGNAQMAADEIHSPYPVVDRLNNCEQVPCLHPTIGNMSKILMI